jgi:hypothetical protein
MSSLSPPSDIVAVVGAVVVEETAAVAGDAAVVDDANACDRVAVVDDDEEAAVSVPATRVDSEHCVVPTLRGDEPLVVVVVVVVVVIGVIVVKSMGNIPIIKGVWWLYGVRT